MKKEDEIFVKAMSMVYGVPLKDCREQYKTTLELQKNIANTLKLLNKEMMKYSDETYRFSMLVSYLDMFLSQYPEDVQKVILQTIIRSRSAPNSKSADVKRLAEQLKTETFK